MGKLSAATEDTAPTTDDYIYTVHDPGGTPASRRATIANFLKIINTLTEDTAPDEQADYVMSYDTSAAGVKKVKIKNFSPWNLLLKTADETVAASTTLQNDNDISVTLAASTKYALRGKIFFDTVAAADFKYRWTGSAVPTTTRLRWKHVVPGTTASVEGVETAFATTTVTVVGAGTTMGFLEFDCYINNNTSGTFIFQWAQNTSDAGNTTVLAGSYMEYMVVA